MTILARDGSGPIRSAVRMTEHVCALPAVATQDWCDRAAAALLPIMQPSVAVLMIAEVDERGVILRQEATGVAGCYTAEVTTTVGRVQTANPVVPIDPSDASLAHVRTNLAQAKELSWAPGPIVPGSCKAGIPEQFGLPSSVTALAQTPLGRRWTAVRFNCLLLGAVALGNANNGRCLIVEIGGTGAPTTDPDADAAVLNAVLPTLSRRALQAVGQDPTDTAHWLTAREQVILNHLLLGKSVREIADELGRSPHTVHDHVKSLHRKLRASSRGELVARALGHLEIITSPTGARTTTEIRSTQNA